MKTPTIPPANPPFPCCLIDVLSNKRVLTITALIVSSPIFFMLLIISALQTSILITDYKNSHPLLITTTILSAICIPLAYINISALLIIISDYCSIRAYDE